MRMEPLITSYLLNEDSCYVNMTSFGKGSEYILEPYYFSHCTSLYRSDKVIFVGMIALLVRRTLDQMESLCLH